MTSPLLRIGGIPYGDKLGLRVVTLGLGLFFWFAANAAPSRDPSLREFRQYCREHRARPEHLRLSAPQIGTLAYFPTWALEGSQARFSWASFKRKLAKGWEFELGAYADKKRDKWVFTHDDYRSFYPPSRAIKAVYYRGALHVVDGHHRALISTYLGAETLPVEIIDDKSALSPAKFRREMESQNKSYFRDHKGQHVGLVDLCEMADDPNLELARILIGRIDITFVNDEMKLENLRGPRWTIGLKSELDIPFLEFEVADALRRAGIEWNNESESSLSYSQLEEFLEILKQEAKKPRSRLKKVLLFDEPSRASKLKLREILQKHLNKIGCEAALTLEGSPQ